MEMIEVFKKNKALLQGHFLLSSGLHSEYYMQSALLLQNPKLAEKLAKIIARKVKLIRKKIDLVVSPAIGGIVIGQEIARGIGGKCRAIFTERDSRSNEMILRRGFDIKPGEIAVVVEDVITTGGTTRELINLVDRYEARLVAVCSLVDRSGGKAEFKVPKVSLLSMDIKAYNESECPFCRQNIPVVKPGSKKR